MQTFSLLLGLGALAGLLLVAWSAPKKDIIRYVDAAAIALFISLLCSRAFYVTVNWGYYTVHPSEILQVWQGGLSGIGALAGGLLAVVILAAWWQLPAGLLADTLLPLAITLSLTAWLGCWLEGIAYGIPSHLSWVLPVKDEWGNMTARVPVQLFGAVLSLLLLWLMDRASRPTLVHGLSASIGFLGIAAIIFTLSYLRADPVPIWHNLRLEAWGALGLMAISACSTVVLLLGRKMKKIPQPSR